MQTYSQNFSGYQESFLSSNQQVPNLDFMEIQSDSNQQALPIEHELQSSGPSLRFPLGQNSAISMGILSSQSTSNDGIHKSFTHVTPKSHTSNSPMESGIYRRTITKPVFTAEHHEVYTPQIKIMMSQSYATTSNILQKDIPQIEGAVTEILESFDLLIQPEPDRVKESKLPELGPTGSVTCARPQGFEAGLVEQNISTNTNPGNPPPRQLLSLARYKRHQIRHMLKLIDKRLQRGVSYNGMDPPHSSVFEPELWKEDDETVAVLNQRTELAEERERWKTMQSNIDLAKERIESLCWRLQSLTNVWKCAMLGCDGAVLDRASFGI